MMAIENSKGGLERSGQGGAIGSFETDRSGMDLIKTSLGFIRGLQAQFAPDHFIRISIVTGTGSTIDSKGFAFVTITSVVADYSEIPTSASDCFRGVCHVTIFEVGAGRGVRIDGVDRILIDHHQSH